ncbi:MAG: cation diffusion facilitator family transporter [Candidatus Kariarchaeaceae archaeon]|jgi:cation diffusion facilitator family transporter
MAGASLKTALFANLLIGIGKFIVGNFTQSAAMISEAIHSFADTSNQILLAIGIRSSKRNPDVEHPFGYSKNQFFWAFVVAVLIFGISGILAFNEGLHKVRDTHHEIDKGKFIWNIVVLLGAIILESYAFKTAFQEARHFQKETGSESIVRALDEMQDPVLLSLLVEDSLALIGLVVALIGVMVAYVTEDPVIDGYTSIFIGIILMVGGLLLARENKTYLIGKAVTSATQQTIKSTVESFEGVKEVRGMRTMLLGPKDMILTLDVVFTEEVEKDDVAEAIDKLEAEIVKAVPTLKPSKIFIEAQ